MKTLTPILCLLALLGVPQASQATSYYECYGMPIKWNTSFALWRNPCTIPTTGVINDAFNNAVNQWRSITNLISAVNTTIDCSSPKVLNKRSEVSLVDPSELDGAAGIARMIFSTSHVDPLHPNYFLYSCPASTLTVPPVYTEVDVLIANYLDFSNPSETSLAPNNGREIMLHEFGHMLGLNHENSWMSIMRTNTPLPLVGGIGEHASVLADEAWGMNTLYGTSMDANLYITPAYIENNILKMDPTTIEPACRGQLVFATFSMGNMGRNNLGNVLVWGEFRNLFTGQSYYWPAMPVNFGGFYNWNRITLPLFLPTSMPYGLYQLSGILDYPGIGVISERRENDNRARNPKLFHVVCG